MRRDRTSGQIGAALGLAAPTVQKYARDGRVPYDVTPGGHRRFHLDEVRAALFGPSPSLRDAPLPVDGGLGAGLPVGYSPAAAAERDTRALVATTSEDETASPTALQEVERDVLSKAGARIRQLARSYTSADSPTDVMRLVAATEEWYVEATDRNVKLHAILTEGSADDAGLWSHKTADWHHQRIDRAAEQLRKDLAQRLPPNSGYALAVNPTTLDRVPASQFMSWAVWTLEGSDPLGAD